MKKKYALILAVLFTLVVSNFFLLSSVKDKETLESGIVARVIDGDTLELEDGRVVRLTNINSPEKSSSLYIQSLDYLKDYENETIYFEVLGIEKYGRTLARIYNQNNDYLNLNLVKLGLASKFLVEESELKLFNNAEDEAVKRSEGIWNKSSYSGCVSAEIDEKNEIVNIKNSCTSIDTTSWIAKDESRKEYKFNILLESEVNLHSGKGDDNSTDIFWNAGTNVWNNDRDTIYIFDNENNLVFHKSYGY